MASDLKMTLKLGAAECFRGESVFFDAVVRNGGATARSGIQTFDRWARALTVTATPADAKPRPAELAPPEIPGQRSANAMSLLEREGRHEHGPDVEKLGTLAPGASWKARGDILQWLGELPPGAYRIAATFNAGDEVVESEPAPLRIHDIRPVDQAASRRGECAAGTRLTAAFVHQTAEASFMFMQCQSEAMPKTPVRGLRLPASRPADLRPAALGGTSAPNAHVFWQAEGNWQGAMVPLEGAEPKVVPFPAPFGGAILRSPLSLADGGAMVPFASAGGDKVALVRLMPDGAGAPPVPINLDKGGAVGPYACLWQQELALHLVWANKGGREVWHAATPFLDPAALPATRSLFVAAEPVLWLDAWIDTDAMSGVRPMFKETGGEHQPAAQAPVPLMLKVWCIAARPQKLVCTEFSSSDSRLRTVAVFDTGDVGALEIFESVVRPDGHIALLASDKSGVVYYASTGANRFAPLAKLIGVAVARTQQPVLFSASRRGTLPWVYVRSLDASNGRLANHKIEPFGESEPAEHHHAH